jgi:hypothetical protein
MSLEQKRNDIGIHHYRRCGVQSKCDRPRAFLTKRPDQRHEFLGPFGIIFGIGLQIFQADWRFEDKASRKSHLIRSSFRIVGSLWHLDTSLTHQTVWA